MAIIVWLDIMNIMILVFASCLIKTLMHSLVGILHMYTVQRESLAVIMLAKVKDKYFGKKSLAN